MTIIRWLGGPDGDLGSNEILLSSERTVAVVDGSGVLYDPHGINQAELAKLAKHRQMTRLFDKCKLSSDGFFVDVEDVDVTLPNGEVVQRGIDFRNQNLASWAWVRQNLASQCAS